MLTHTSNKKIGNDSKKSYSQKYTRPSSSQNQIQQLHSSIGNQAVQKLFEQGSIQAKLTVTVGAPDDKYEREADYVAETVMRMLHTPTIYVDNDRQKKLSSQFSILQTKPKSPRQIQRVCAECEEDLITQRKEVFPLMIQAKLQNASTPNVSSNIAKFMQHTVGGSQLPATIKNKIEPVLNADLSHVRVHSDNKANEAAQGLNAKAFTHKNNIWLGKGQSVNDIHLMAHEATHVIQQNSTNQGKYVQCSPENDVFPVDVPALKLDKAPNALSGIQLYLMVDILQLPRGIVRTVDIFHHGQYLIAPHTTIEKSPNILFYVAYRKARGQNEWVIGPDSINSFLENVALYEGAGNVAYPGSEKIPETMLDRPEKLESPISEGLHTGGSGGASFISAYDAHKRLKHYVKPAQELAKRIRADVVAGKVGHIAGSEQAIAGRNLLLKETRGKLSPGARAFSKAIKEEGKTAAELIDKYSKELLASDPKIRARYGLDVLEEGSDLYKARYKEILRKIGQTEDVSMEIISAAGRTGRVVTGVAKVTKVLGPVGTLASLGISGYEIYDAPASQKLHVVAREAGGFAGGTLGAIGGGMVGAWVASLACGPGAPVCALIVTVFFVGAGGYLGGRAGEYAGEKMLPSLFTAPAYIPLALPVLSLSAGGGYAGIMERDRRKLLDESRPMWMKLNGSIKLIEEDINFLEGRIRTAEDKEELEKLQKIRVELLLKLNEITILYEALYPSYKEKK